MHTGLSVQRFVRRRRRIAKVEFEDGSHCGCGHLCEALEGGCCERSMCTPPDGEDTDAMASQDAAHIYAGAPASEAADSLTRLNDTRSRPCKPTREHNHSLPGGVPIVVSWINRARHPIQLSVSTRWPPLRQTFDPTAPAASRPS